jgi:hypothetical protein
MILHIPFGNGTIRKRKHLPIVTSTPPQTVVSQQPPTDEVRSKYLERFRQMPVAEQEAHLLIAFQWLTRNVTRQSDQQRE